MFQRELNSELLKIDLSNADLLEFTKIALPILDRHDPKNKRLYEQTTNFVTKNLRKAIMKKSKRRNKYLRERTSESKSLYNIQRNLNVSILRKNKRDYFGNLNNKIVTGNRKFWKTISPLLSKKAFHRECITLKKVIKQLQIMKN